MTTEELQSGGWTKKSLKPTMQLRWSNQGMLQQKWRVRWGRYLHTWQECFTDEWLDVPKVAESALASAPTWVKCSERMPTYKESDDEGMIWVYDVEFKQQKPVLRHYASARHYTHWMPTGLVRPEPPKET